MGNCRRNCLNNGKCRMIADIPACICTSEFTGAMCQVSGKVNHMDHMINYGFKNG